MNQNETEQSEIDHLEITSPRTAEKPGPVLSNEDECCSIKPKSQLEHEHGNSSYIPTVFSLLLLLTGIALDFFEVPWFSGYLRVIVFGIAYILVGGKVVKHAITNIAKG